MINQIILTALPISDFWNPATIIGSLFVALIIAGAVMLYKRSKLKSVRFERTACNYVRPGSFKLTIKRDNFLFANTTRIPRQQSTPGGGRRRR